jgi:nucleoside-diphosphate-sugar epimerase
MSPSTPRTRVLVTGAGRFIGRHVAKRLIARRCEVHGISRSETGGDDKNIRWWQGDVTDSERIDAIVSAARPEIIVHLASHVSGDRSLSRVLPILRENLLSAVNVLVVASKAGCRRVILAGSLEEPHAGEDFPTPASPYAAAKWAASGYARMFHALYRLPVVLVRIAMTYGPGQVDDTKLVPYVVRSLLRGESPALTSGRKSVDWVYVEDLAEGIACACFAEAIDGKTIDLGSGTCVPVREVVTQLVAITNPSVVPQFGAIPDRPLERALLADTAAAKALLGWRAVTPLDEGLRRTVAWYRENRY